MKAHSWTHMSRTGSSLLLLLSFLRIEDVSQRLLVDLLRNKSVHKEFLLRQTRLLENLFRTFLDTLGFSKVALCRNHLRPRLCGVPERHRRRRKDPRTRFLFQRSSRLRVSASLQYPQTRGLAIRLRRPLTFFRRNFFYSNGFFAFAYIDIRIDDVFLFYISRKEVQFVRSERFAFDGHYFDEEPTGICIVQILFILLKRSLVPEFVVGVGLFTDQFLKTPERSELRRTCTTMEWSF